MIALLFLAALALYARAEMEYHPQAILNYLEMEDREMVRKVRSIVNARGLSSGKPSFPPSFKPPKDLPPNIVSCNILYPIRVIQCMGTVCQFMHWVGLKKSPFQKNICYSFEEIIKLKTFFSV